MVGQTKDNLVAVDSGLCVEEVCKEFGSFTTLVVEKDVPPMQPTRGLRNAFEVLLASSHSQTILCRLAFLHHETRNTKQERKAVQ